MFIKRGDNSGKIISVIEEEELTDDQKKLAKNLAKTQVKSDIQPEPSVQKTSEKQ
jgi:hypothetical protein